MKSLPTKRLQPDSRDPEKTWEEIWNMAYAIAQKKDTNCTYSAKLLAQITYARDITTNWVTQDAAEKRLQKNLRMLYTKFTQINSDIQNRKDISDHEWKKFIKFLQRIKP